MVFAVHMNVAHTFAKNTQSREELLALVCGHIGIHGAVQQKQRCVDFIGVEQGRLFHIEFGVVPRIAAVLRHLTVGISPIASAPIARDVGNTGMRNGGCKDVGARLQILRHKSAIGSAHATNLFGIHIRVLGAEGLGSLNDVVGRALSPGSDVACSKFLTETNGTAGLASVDHVALCGKHLKGELKLEHFRRRRATTIIIDDKRILLGLIEIGGQEVETSDAVAAR